MLQPPSYVLHITPLSPTVNAKGALLPSISGLRGAETKGTAEVVGSGGLFVLWAEGQNGGRQANRRRGPTRARNSTGDAAAGKPLRGKSG